MHDEMRQWLEEQLMPLSRVGVRLGQQPVFRRGAEAAAQASIDVLLDAEAWNEIHVDSARARLPQVPDIGQTLMAAAARSLDLVDLARLARFLEFFDLEYAHWHGLIARISGCALAPEHLAQIESVHASLRSGMTADGYLLENNTNTTIAALRSALRKARDDFAEWCGNALSDLRAFGLAAAHQPEFLVLRSAAALLEKSDIAMRIRVARETPDFFMCALRYDEDALRMLSHAQIIEHDLSEAEAHVLEAYGTRILAANATLELACAWVAQLDVWLARRACTVRYGLRRAIVAEDGEFACAAAVCIPLREHVGPRYTPLDLQFANIAVLSGANMGGKTSALNTLALLAHCVARGLPVPAASARLPLFERVLWFGEARSQIGEGLSAFGLEMTELRDIVSLADESTFVILDEVARTTTPREGRALCIAVLQALVARQATVVAATHFDGVANRCAAAHFRLIGIRPGVLTTPGDAAAGQVLRNLEDAFDRRFERVDDTCLERSQAFEVAAALGMPGDVIAIAERELV